MADHFVSLNRGEPGGRYNEFATATVATTSDLIELRITDSAITRKDAILALEAFERFLNNPAQYNVAGFLFVNN